MKQNGMLWVQQNEKSRFQPRRQMFLCPLKHAMLWAPFQATWIQNRRNVVLDYIIKHVRLFFFHQSTVSCFNKFQNPDEINEFRFFPCLLRTPTKVCFFSTLSCGGDDFSSAARKSRYTSFSGVLNQFLVSSTGIALLHRKAGKKSISKPLSSIVKFRSGQ
ncbi:LAFA_0D07492g1_1 [Lachancea sp. 'fantastica']|nr:LAFA_0D07492g1_1 [Lachancea sp. 'fantastica']